MSPSKEEPNNPFGRAVREVLQKHGLSARGQRHRTGIPHSTIAGWFHGIPPQSEGVIAFAEGFDLDVNEWLELAGKKPITADSDLAGAIRLLEHLDALQAEFPDYPVPVPRFAGGVRRITPAEADEWKELIRAHILREIESSGGGG